MVRNRHCFSSPYDSDIYFFEILMYKRSSSPHILLNVWIPKNTGLHLSGKFHISVLWLYENFNSLKQYHGVPSVTPSQRYHAGERHEFAHVRRATNDIWYISMPTSQKSWPIGPGCFSKHDRPSHTRRLMRLGRANHLCNPAGSNAAFHDIVRPTNPPLVCALVSKAFLSPSHRLIFHSLLLQHSRQNIPDFRTIARVHAFCINSPHIFSYFRRLHIGFLRFEVDADGPWLQRVLASLKGVVHVQISGFDSAPNSTFDISPILVQGILELLHLPSLNKVSLYKIHSVQVDLLHAAMSRVRTLSLSEIRIFTTPNMESSVPANPESFYLEELVLGLSTQPQNALLFLLRPDSAPYLQKICTLRLHWHWEDNATTYRLVEFLSSTLQHLWITSIGADFLSFSPPILYNSDVGIVDYAHPSFSLHLPPLPSLLSLTLRLSERLISSVDLMATINTFSSTIPRVEYITYVFDTYADLDEGFAPESSIFAFVSAIERNRAQMLNLKRVECSLSFRLNQSQGVREGLMGRLEAFARERYPSLLSRGGGVMEFSVSTVGAGV
ncbi:hypothetical protein R3P38DRAFT_3465820 [Favolaschia claudopus]|uniref:F-box domain-containing protein n=1 Tax=Favolaschia claudopus TaxID=2862362 RepID=A0AAV9ZFS1_9AGAR